MIAALPRLTTQERHTLRQLRSVAAMLDYRRKAAAQLEHRLRQTPGSLERSRLVRDLLAARQAEQHAILDLHDGVVHLAGLVIVPNHEEET